MGLIRSVGALGAATLALALAGPARGQSGTEILQEEEFLRTAPIITVAKREMGGRTMAWRVYLNDGQKAVPAIFKYVNRQRPNFLASSYRYELAAYALDKRLGLGFIPPTVEREVEGLPGSLQLYCEDVITEAVRRRKRIAPDDPTHLQDRFSEMGLFENLTNCPRLDEGDILIRTSDWRVWRIDYSDAFAPEETLLADSPFPRCSKRLYARLREIPDDELESLLAPYLNAEEIQALLVRRRLIVEKIEDLIRDKGEAAVLFEP
jgi:hypothetical protein